MAGVRIGWAGSWRHVFGADAMLVTMGAAAMAEKDDPGGSFDNRNVFTQIEYLMGAFAAAGGVHYRDGTERGLSYLLANQFERVAAGRIRCRPPMTASRG